MIDNLTGKQLKSMNIGELNALCEELRKNIIRYVMENGGHLSSNLGMVELTVALHYVFDFPEDKVVFDVGHQCYTHKMLSGRLGGFSALRKKGGLSGFPKREESEYDCYNTGHAGTSVSAALGIAKARDLACKDFNVIAVIGDGSFNNGLVYEAFNSLRPLNTNILVIINDNGMSISPTVGSMHEYLDYLAGDSEESYHNKRRAEIFEKFGFDYDGVYDGNDLACMIEQLKRVKEQLKTRSVILHVLTKKGKGYSFCEDNPEATHGIGVKSARPSVEYSQVFGDTLCELAKKNDKIVAVTAAMTGSLGLNGFFEKFPERAIDVGICEEHAAILCASMATEGFRPYYAIYSTFLQRSFDEIIIDICSQNLPVTLCIDRAGISGADGETHQGVFDLSFLSLIPGLTIAVPKDADELRAILEWSVNFNGPLAIRYPRACGNFFGKSEIKGTEWEYLRRAESDTVILACGERAIARSLQALQIAEKGGRTASLINARFIKPLDKKMLSSLGEKRIITVEDNVLIGGFGSLVCEYFAQSGKIVKNFAYCDKFIPQGGVSELMDEYGLDTAAIADYILKDET